LQYDIFLPETCVSVKLILKNREKKIFIRLIIFILIR
jgi:hypothetical protein